MAEAGKDPNDTYVEQVSAACMFMRRELIDEAGPWDEGFRC